MGSWIEEKPTMELRWAERETVVQNIDNMNVYKLHPHLQQLWKIARGGLGRVEYTEEWRDVPRVFVKREDDGR